EELDNKKKIALPDKLDKHLIKYMPPIIPVLVILSSHKTPKWGKLGKEDLEIVLEKYK
ncbi:45068_t:CDS:2, partial [Gigaspora margarita]